MSYLLHQKISCRCGKRVKGPDKVTYKKIEFYKGTVGVRNT